MTTSEGPARLVVFALRFLMLDRLFTRLNAAEEGRPLPTPRRGTT